MDDRFYTVVQVWDGIKMVYHGTDQNEVLNWVSKEYGDDPSSERRAKLRIRGIVVSKAEEEAEKARLLEEKKRIPGSFDGSRPVGTASSRPATGALPSIFQQKLLTDQSDAAKQARRKTGRMRLSDLDTLDGNAEAEENLRRAAAENNSAVIKQLLKGKVNPNTQNERGWTALHMAIFRNQTLAASVLLQHPKCDPNTASQEGNTALHWCALRDNTTIGGLILNNQKVKKENLNQRNKVGFTALHIAASRNSAPFYKLLLEEKEAHDRLKRKVDVLLKNKELETAEEVALRIDAKAVLDIAERIRRQDERERKLYARERRMRERYRRRPDPVQEPTEKVDAKVAEAKAVLAVNLADEEDKWIDRFQST